MSKGDNTLEKIKQVAKKNRRLHSTLLHKASQVVKLSDPIATL